MPAQIVVAQRVFSGGQVTADVRRNEDDKVYKIGLRQCVNFRLLAAGGVENRFGRTAQYFDGPRVERFLMAPGQVFDICFSAGKLQLRKNGVLVFTATGLPWTAANLKTIVYAPFRTQIFITFPGMQPKVITWTINTTTFAIADYSVMFNGSQKRAPFYRIARHDIALLVSAAGPAGATVNLSTFPDAFFEHGMEGTYLQFIGRQLKITAVFDEFHAAGQLVETLYPGFSLAVNGNAQIAIPGDVFIGQVSGAKLLVTLVTGVSTLNVQSLNGVGPGGANSGDALIGPAGSIGVAQGITPTPPFAVTLWDQEVMNDFQGWPQSCFADQNRLGFTNFPRVPPGVCWSAINSPTDLYVPPLGLSAENSIFELAPGKSQVYYVLPGAESDEFVFADNAVYWIPINVQNPLTATGAVVFNKIDEGANRIQPRVMRDTIIYINAAANSVRAIAATGAYNRPYEARDLTVYHQALLSEPIAIACPDGDDPSYPERYVYVLNSDGTLVVGYLDVENGQLTQPPGWVPWHGVGAVTWVAARIGEVLFTTQYPGAAGPLVELLDPLRYMDASFEVNSPPAGLVPPAGKGPLWWQPSHPVMLLDKGLRQMGVYEVDADGFIIPQFIGGENLASPELVAGQMWSGIVEPFIPSPGPGQDARQRMTRRRVARMSIYFNASTGFVFVRMYSGKQRPGAPLPGTVMGSRRVPTYLMGDDPTQSAPLRDGAEFWRPKGRSYDPRVAFVKDTVGPLTILEFGAEVTV